MKIEISTEFIKLDSAMKLSGAVSIGSDAKYSILDGQVTVNGEQELRRGRKLYKGDKFCFEGQTYEIV
ncbi:MAG: RNA-binding S4 domain-containing protein [Clostridia bacterium]